MKFYEYIAHRIEDENEFLICDEHGGSQRRVKLSNMFVFPTERMWTQFRHLLECSISVEEDMNGFDRVALKAAPSGKIAEFALAVSDTQASLGYQLLTGVGATFSVSPKFGVIPSEYVSFGPDLASTL